MFNKKSPFRVLLGIVFMALFMALLQQWIRNWKKNQVIFTYKLKPVITPPEKQIPAAPKKMASKKPGKDDLTIISGVGPKTASLFQSIGITSFKQISEMKLAELSKILKDANLRATDAESWIAQCKQFVK